MSAGRARRRTATAVASETRSVSAAPRNSLPAMVRGNNYNPKIPKMIAA
jgi:hypothetical protein